MPKEDMPPPEGMSEEKYAELLMTERGCQICKQTIKCKVYWEFAIRCCEECHSNKTVSRSLLIGRIKYPEEFVDIMPYTHISSITRYYWRKQIDFAYSQYYSLSKKKKKIWLNDKKIVLDSIMNYAKQRRQRELREYEERKKSRNDYPFYFHPPPQFPIVRRPLSPFFLFRRIHVPLFDNFLGNHDEQESDNFIETKKKKGKGELKNKFHNNKLNKSNMKMKGKNFKNKFAYKYG
ncbi:hypothetical protein RclHR1_08910003 [Rhizophagus clarus]|nr:hypothetical protein RclHR1_08910003 [Rhizophagus clarus]